MSETVLIYLAAGSNLGDRLGNLINALEGLPPQVIPLRTSPVYETPPWGVLDQPKFLNLVFEAETRLAPVELLKYLKDLETRLGRQPGRRYGPRVIDLDILFYQDRILNLPELQIPHPQMAARLFVLRPLADLAPDARHPQSGLTVRELLASLPPEEISRHAPPLPVNLDQDFRLALRADPAARERFALLPASHRKAYTDWIAEAKKPDTRARRVAQTLIKLKES